MAIKVGVYVTVHAKMCHKSAKKFPRFPRISHYYSRFYLRTKFDRHSPFTFRDIAFIRGRRKSTFAETAIFVRLRVIAECFRLRVRIIPG